MKFFRLISSWLTASVLLIACDVNVDFSLSFDVDFGNEFEIELRPEPASTLDNIVLETERKGVLTVDYPSNWFVDIDDTLETIKITDNPDLLEIVYGDPIDFLDNAIYLTLNVFDGLAIDILYDGVTETDEFLINIVGANEDTGNETFDSIIEYQIAQTTGYAIRGTGSDQEALFIAFKRGDNFVLMAAFTSLDEIELYEDTIQIIADSIQYTPPQTTAEEDEPSIELSNTVSVDSSDFGQMTLMYPEGWFSDAQDLAGTIIVASSADGLQATSLSDVPQDGVILTITAFPTEIASILGGNDAGAFLQAMLGQISNAADVPEFGEPEDYEIAGTIGSATQGSDENIEGIIIVFEKNGGLIMMVAVAPAGEFSSQEATVQAIANSIEYTPPDSEIE